MAIIGIDYGDRKVGVAKAADGQAVAVPLAVLKHRGLTALVAELAALCEREGATKLVVGVPLSLSGGGATKLRPADQANGQMRKVLAFVERLRKRLAIPVEIQDERLSTQEAVRLRGSIRGQPEDAVAAMLILQSWLDRNRGG